MCVDCVLASPRIAQVDPGDESPSRGGSVTGTSVMYLHFEDSHLKILDSRVKFSGRFNSKVRGYT
jgi:hypothetical protein